MDVACLGYQVHDYIPAQSIARWQSKTLGKSKIQPRSLTFAPKSYHPPQKIVQTSFFRGKRC